MSAMSEDLRQKWEEFLAGEWNMDPPTKEGNYSVADAQGNFTGGSFIVYKKHDGDSLGFAMHGHTSGVASDIWKGYFWSVATPRLPSVNQSREDPTAPSIPKVIP